jgi:hypothetical protein
MGKNIVFPGFQAGFNPGGGSFSTFSLNTATAWLAQSFIPADDLTLNEVRVNQSTKGGAPAAGDYSCEIWSNSAGNGLPNAILAGSATGSVGSVPANGYFDFAGINVALSKGVMYWVVFKNLNATPGTNNFTLAAAANNAMPFPGMGGNSKYGWAKATWNGTVWSNNGVGINAMRLKYSNGSYDGVPLQSASATSAAYGTNEAGARFVMPIGCGYWCDSISFFTRKTGTPTGDLRFKLYVYAPDGTTLLSTTTSQYGVTQVDLTTSTAWIRIALMPPVFIPAGSVVRAVMSETTQSDLVANNYGFGHTTCDTDANSIAMYPMQMKLTSTTNGTVATPTWTDTAGILPGCLLSLQPGNEVAPVASAARLVGTVR